MKVYMFVVLFGFAGWFPEPFPDMDECLTVGRQMVKFIKTRNEHALAHFACIPNKVLKNER